MIQQLKYIIGREEKEEENCLYKEKMRQGKIVNVKKKKKKTNVVLSRQQSNLVFEGRIYDKGKRKPSHIPKKKEEIDKQLKNPYQVCQVSMLLN